LPGDKVAAGRGLCSRRKRLAAAYRWYMLKLRLDEK